MPEREFGAVLPRQPALSFRGGYGAGGAVPTQEQLDRLDAVVPFAQATMAKWHVPASVSLAQWTFESSWGTSGLAETCNNVFGIKRGQRDYSQPYATYQTAEFATGSNVAHMEAGDFLRFPSVADCFQAHGKLIGGTARYLNAMSVTDDVPAFCRALQSCGYSTNPKYARMLLDQIDHLNLERYDTLPTTPIDQRTT